MIDIPVPPKARAAWISELDKIDWNDWVEQQGGHSYYIHDGAGLLRRIVFKDDKDATAFVIKYSL